MNKTLVILAHPNLNEQSISNKVIIHELEKESSITTRNLYELYPTFEIDVKAEQEALIEADNIVFQFPFYWYSVPGILKHWQDLVFIYGFAYGRKGTKLKNKNLIVSTTIGGEKDSYNKNSYNTFKVDDLLKPLEQTSNLVGMKFQKPICSYGMAYIPNVLNEKDQIEEKARVHAKNLIEALHKLKT